MLLNDFLKKQKITKKSFSQRIGVSSVAVSYYCSRKRIPCYRIMEKIFESTGGKVTPNDFLNLNYGEHYLDKIANESNLEFHDTKKPPKNPPKTPLIIGNTYSIKINN